MTRWITDLAIWLFEWAKWGAGAIFAWIEWEAWWRIKMAWFDRRCLRRKPRVKVQRGAGNPIVSAEFIRLLDEALKNSHHGPFDRPKGYAGQLKVVDREESEGQNGQADKGRDQHKIPPPPAER